MALIAVIEGGKTHYDAFGLPSKVGGTPGFRDTEEMELREVVTETDDEYSVATEYWLNGELMHRSAHVTMKRWPDPILAEVGKFL